MTGQEFRKLIEENAKKNEESMQRIKEASKRFNNTVKKIMFGLYS